MMIGPADSQPEKRVTRIRTMDRQFEVDLEARIRAARAAAGLSQFALGTALGISFQQIQKYEGGRDRVAVSTLQALAAALHVPLLQLLDADTPALDGDAKLLRATIAVAVDWQRIGSLTVRKRLAAVIAAVARGGAKIEGDTKAGHEMKRRDAEPIFSTRPVLR